MSTVADDGETKSERCSGSSNAPASGSSPTIMSTVADNGEMELEGFGKTSDALAPASSRNSTSPVTDRNETMPERPGQSSYALKDLLRPLRRVNRAADEAVLTSYCLGADQDTLENCYRFLEENTNKMMDVLESRLSQGESPEISSFKELKGALLYDHVAFRAQMKRLRDSQKEFNRLQGRLKMRTTQLRKALEAAGDLLGESVADATDTFSSESEGSEWSHRSKKSPPTPAVLQQYYEAKGNVGVAYEQLMDHESQHQDDIDSREVSRDRGDTLQISDEEFTDLYEAKKRELIGELAEASAEADRCADLCEAAGITLDMPPASFSEATSQNPIARQSPLDVHAPGSGAQPSEPHLQRVPSVTRRKIRNWMAHLSSGSSSHGTSPNENAVSDDNVSDT